MAQESPTEPTQQAKRPRQKFPLWIMYVSIAVAFGWLIFLALWLFYYASGFSILQNIAIFLLSLVIALALEAVLWVPWSMKQV
jgi:hypothetical protein